MLVCGRIDSRPEEDATDNELVLTDDWRAIFRRLPEVKVKSLASQ